MPEKKAAKKEKKTTVTGWVADKLKGTTATGKKAKGGELIAKIKPEGEYKTKSQATRAFLAGLFKSMKKQGKDVKVGKGAAESIRVNAATLAETMIDRVMAGENALKVLTRGLK